MKTRQKHSWHYFKEWKRGKRASAGNMTGWGTLSPAMATMERTRYLESPVENVCQCNRCMSYRTWWEEWTSSLKTAVPQTTELFYGRSGIEPAPWILLLHWASCEWTRFVKLLLWATWWEKWTGGMMIALPLSYHMMGVTDFLDYRTVVSMMGRVTSWWQQYCWATWWEEWTSSLMTAVPLSNLMGGVNQLLDDSSTTELPDGRSELAPWWQQYHWATWWEEWTSYLMTAVPLSYLMGGVN